MPVAGIEFKIGVVWCAFVKTIAPADILSYVLSKVMQTKRCEPSADGFVRYHIVELTLLAIPAVAPVIGTKLTAEPLLHVVRVSYTTEVTLPGSEDDRCTEVPTINTLSLVPEVGVKDNSRTPVAVKPEAITSKTGSSGVVSLTSLDAVPVP